MHVQDATNKMTKGVSMVWYVDSTTVLNITNLWLDVIRMSIAKWAFYCTSRNQCTGTACHSEYCYKNWWGIGDGGKWPSMYHLCRIGVHICLVKLCWLTHSTWHTTHSREPNNDGDCALGLVCGINNWNKLHETIFRTGIPTTDDCYKRKSDCKHKTITTAWANFIIIVPACFALALCISL